jgi:hypothetical protein
MLIVGVLSSHVLHIGRVVDLDLEKHGEGTALGVNQQA